MAPRYALALHLHSQHTVTHTHTHIGTQTYTTCALATATRQFGTSVHWGEGEGGVWEEEEEGGRSCSNTVRALSLSSSVSACLYLVLSLPVLPICPSGIEASAQLLCATYRVSPIVMGNFVVVNTGHYSSRSSLRDVSMAWKASPKCREL